MSNPMNKGTLFAPELVKELINKVKGESSLAKLSGRKPIPFNGTKEFTFNFDSEIDIVAESGAKSHGGITLEPVTILPIKFEYGARVSDEFMYAAEDEQLDILSQFSEGFAKKAARGMDLAAFHGVNPRTGAASAVVGNNNFDYAVSQHVSYGTGTADEDVESAIALVNGSDRDVSGIAMAPALSAALAQLKNSANERLYPELAWGGKPKTLNGMPISINRTVSDMTLRDDGQASPTVIPDVGIVGDFANMFRWGYAKQIPTQIIQYGDPDNSGHDLKGYNQIYIRAELYLGWGILDPAAFALIY